MAKNLKKISSSQVAILKLKNRRGFAALCRNHLTEGRSPVQAFERMVKAVKRSGFLLAGNPPRPR